MRLLQIRRWHAIKVNSTVAFSVFDDLRISFSERVMEKKIS